MRVSLWNGTSGPHARTWTSGLRAARSGSWAHEQPGGAQTQSLKLSLVGSGGENTSTAPYAGWRRVVFEAGDVEDVHGTDGPPPTEGTRDEGAGRSA